MQVKPVAGPHAVQSNNPNPQAERDAKARAIAKLQPTQQPVQNQNAVTPEEFGSLAASTSKNLQKSTVEATEESQAPVEEPTEKKPETDPLSRQYAILARQEKALRAKQQQQDQAYKAREDALNQREQQIQAKLSAYESGYISKDSILKDPVAVFETLGLDYDKITESYLNYQKLDPRVNSMIQSLQDEVKALKADRENSQKTSQEEQSKAYQTAVAQIKADATELVNSDPAFETVKITGSVSDVVQLIEETYHKEGRLLTIEEAATEVEEYLIAEIERVASKSNKIKQRLIPQTGKVEQEAGSKTAAPDSKQPQTTKTLNNTMSSSRQMSARERAIAAMQGRLK